MMLGSVNVIPCGYDIDQGGPEPVGGEPHPNQDAPGVASSCHAKN